MGLRDFVEQRRAEKKPKTLAELRAMKQAQKRAGPSSNGLAALRAKKQASKAKASKLDFHRAGIRFHNVQQYNGYWTVDVSNGDKTYTFNNRCGSWMHNVEGREGWMAEPARVARALGTDMSQVEMSQSIMHRLELELRERGIPTREQLLRQHEEEAKAQRRKRRKHSDDDQD